MTKIRYVGEVNTMKGKFHFGLSLLQFKEDEVTIIYSPALDLSGYGNSETEARHSFDEALNEFIRYTSNKKTLGIVLKQLGWEISGSKGKPKYTPPKDSDLVSTNELYNELVNSDKGYIVFKEDIEFAL